MAYLDCGVSAATNIATSDLQDFFYFRTELCKSSCVPSKASSALRPVWSIVGTEFKFVPEQHWVSLHNLSWSSRFLNQMGSLCLFHSSELSWKRGLIRHSSTLQKGCDGAHSGSPAQHCFLGDDGADSCVGPIFDALAGWFHSLPCINSHSPSGYSQEVLVTR